MSASSAISSNTVTVDIGLRRGSAANVADEYLVAVDDEFVVVIERLEFTGDDLVKLIGRIDPHKPLEVLDDISSWPNPMRLAVDRDHDQLWMLSLWPRFDVFVDRFGRDVFDIRCKVVFHVLHLRYALIRARTKLLYALYAV